MINRKTLFILNIGQLILPAILYYAYPIIYNAILPITVDGHIVLGYQWSLITLLLAWGVGSFCSGWIFNRYGTQTGVVVGFMLAFIAFGLLIPLHSSNELIFISLLIGLSLSFLFMDPVIARFKEVGYSQVCFNKRVIQLTLVSGFASTFSYLALNEIYARFSWQHAIYIIILLLLIFFIAYFISFKGKPRKPSRSSSQSSSYTDILSSISLLMILVFSTQGITQTIIFFEIFAYLNKPGDSLSLILASFSLIGVAQVAGRVIIIFQKKMTGKGMIILSSGLMFLGMISLYISINSNIWFISVFALLFGAGLGISTIAKPILVNEVFHENFSFYNGFYSGILNFSRAIMPIVFGLGLLLSNKENMLTALLLGSVIMLLASYKIWKVRKIEMNNDMLHLEFGSKK
ncbi:MFS transporter [Shewanella surugensis]|uniref:MFS transporter n=1 Tax=Shewanella surugensis TaxID=212020 RepID=A0ABT0LC14_9GAMM|nr:MFS transporter [Shewanella surugensis]MCL1125204.1 MFS transporter [Shewanella surugensis]